MNSFAFLKKVPLILIVFTTFLFNNCIVYKRPSDPIQQIENVIEGKNIVVLNFWSIFCLPCLKEIPTISSLHEKYRNDENISINSVALNSENEMKQFFSGDTANTYGNVYKRLNLEIKFPIITYNKYNSNYISKFNAVGPNYENDPSLSLLYAKFNLESIPTTIIFFKGKEYQRFIGFEGDNIQFKKEIDSILFQLNKRL